MKYFKQIFIIAVTAFVLFIIYLEFSGKFILNTSDKRMIAYEIRSSEKIPDHFLNFYNTVYPYSLSSNSWKLLSGSLLHSQAKDCPGNQMAYRIFPVLEISRKKEIDQFTVARFIENNYSQKECLQFNLSHFDFLENRKGLSEVSHSLFKKDVKSLQPLEMGEILAVYENPTKNNRSRNPANAKNRAGHFYNLYIKNKLTIVLSEN